MLVESKYSENVEGSSADSYTCTKGCYSRASQQKIAWLKARKSNQNKTTNHTCQTKGMGTGQ